MQRILWTLALAVGAHVATSTAFAADLAPDHLRITLDTKKSRKPAKMKGDKSTPEQDYKTACDNLGKAMINGAGPWGFGAFTSYSCYRADKLVGGEDKQGAWSLTIVDGAKGVDMTMRFAPGEDEEAEGVVAADLKMAPSKHTMKFFLDDEFTDLVAFALLERMPVGALITKSQVKGEPPTFTGRYPRAGKGNFKYKLPQPPEEIVLYRVSYDDRAKVWRSSVAGTAKRTAIEGPKKGKKPKGKKSAPMTGGNVTYELSESAAKGLEKGPLWAQDAKGPGAAKDQINQIVSEAQTSLNTAAENGQLLDFIEGKVGSVLGNLLDTAASGYVGLRYGLQVLQGDNDLSKKLLSQTSFFGLLLEFRGGPVKGLRYYYDKVPTKEASLDGVNGPMKVSLESARHVLGYSFGFDPGFVFDRVTIDPKIGLWTYRAVLPVEQDPTGKVTKTDEFNLGNTASIALELGLEWLAEWYTLRGWYGIDGGYSLLKTGGRVTSNRFGVDAYFTAGPSFPIFGIPFKTALLAFFIYESVDLTTGEKENPAPGETKASGVSYDAGYAGGGIGITW